MYLPLVEQVQEVQDVGHLHDEVHFLAWQAPQPEVVTLPAAQTPWPEQPLHPPQ